MEFVKMERFGDNFIEIEDFVDEHNPRESKIVLEKKYGTVEDFIDEKIVEYEEKLQNDYEVEAAEFLRDDKIFFTGKQVKNIEDCLLLCQNIKDNYFVLSDKASRDLVIKIYKYLDRNGLLDDYRVEEIIQCIADGNRLIASFFCKDAAKQTIWQKRYFSKILSKVRETNNRDLEKKFYFKDLQKDKKDDESKKWFLHTDGNVARSRETKGMSDIDCVIYTYEGYRYIENNWEKAFYITHKRVGGSGDSESKQYKEMSDFLDNFSKNGNPNEFGIVAIEGAYVTRDMMLGLRGKAKNKKTQVFYASDIDGIMNFIVNNM